MSECTSGRNRELSQIGECIQNARRTDDYHEERAKCIQDAEKAGYEMIGSGTNRLVFDVPDSDCIVKVATGPHGVSANKTEIRVSEEAPPEVQDVLVSVDEEGRNNLWLTMPKVDTDTGLSDVQEVREKMRETDWRCKDTNRGNIGRVDGEAVLFDYGEGCGESGLGKPY